MYLYLYNQLFIKTFKNKNLIGNPEDFSPLHDILESLNIINKACLVLFIILIFQILFKFFLKENITLNLSHLIGVKLNGSLQYYINRIITLNRKINNLYIIFIIVTLLIALVGSIIFINEIYVNLDSYAYEHIAMRK